MREALKLLEQDDIVGRGGFISLISAVQVVRPITVFKSFTDMTRHYGYKPQNKVLSSSEEVPDATIAQQLRLDAGER